jgi:hypothetical protein
MRRPTIGSLIMLVAAPLIGSLMLWFVIFPAGSSDANKFQMKEEGNGDYSDDGFIYEAEESINGFEEAGPKPGAAGTGPGRNETISDNTTLGGKGTVTVNSTPEGSGNSNPATGNGSNDPGNDMLGAAAAKKEAKMGDAEKEAKRAYKEMKKGKRN